MDNMMVVFPDNRRYWVLDGRGERPDKVLCEQAKDRAAYEVQFSALEVKYPSGHILSQAGRDIAWKIEYDRKLADTEAHWVVLLCADEPFSGRIVYGPDTFAECDAYTEYSKDDVRGDLHFEIERVYHVSRSERTCGLVERIYENLSTPPLFNRRKDIKRSVHVRYRSGDRRGCLPGGSIPQ